MEFDEFLKETASLLGLQWRTFQRRGIRRKIEQRITQTGLSQFEEYLSRIKSDSAERGCLSEILTITISRFFRDRDIFDLVENSLIPKIVHAKGKGVLKIWSIGCASGEEPFSFSILWREKFGRVFPEIDLSVLATDVSGNLIERAKEGRYKKSSVKEIDGKTLSGYFKYDESYYVLDQAIRESVEFKRHNILEEEPFLGMDIVFCRNLAFTYFSKESQIKVLEKIASSLNEKGYLVIGKDETLPLIYPTLFVPAFQAESIYQKFAP
jgi:chemotaxis protein methyltransferase CheR